MDKEYSRAQKTVKNTTANIVNRIIYILLGFVLRTVFIYTLGVQYSGVTDVFTNILTMLSLSELGMSTAISAAMYKPIHEGDHEKIQKIMGFYKVAYRIVAAFVVGVGVVLLPFVPYLVKEIPDVSEPLQLIFILYIIKTASSYLIIYKRTIIEADQKQYIIKPLDTYSAIVRYAVEAIMLFVFRNFILYLVLEIAGVLLQNFIITRKVEKLYPNAFAKTNEHLEKQDRKKLFKDIKGAAIYHITATFNNSIDSVLISSLISTTVLGFVSNYTMLRIQVEMILKQFYSAVTPSIGNLAVSKDSNKQGQVFEDMLYLNFLIVNFCAVSLYVLLGPFVNVWLGEGFVLGTNIALIIACDFFANMFLMIVTVFKNSNGFFVIGAYRPIVTTALNIGLSVLFIKLFGLWGTFFATVIARYTTQWYDMYQMNKNIFKRSFGGLFFKYWFYTGLFLLSAFLTGSLSGLFIISNPWLKLIVNGLCCIVIPNVVAIVTTCWMREFREGIYLLKNRKKGKA